MLVFFRFVERTKSTDDIGEFTSSEQMLEENAERWIVNDITEHRSLKMMRSAGEKEKVRKRYRMCSIRELHRDLYDDKMGLAEAIGPDGKELISDTRLRSLIPPFFKPMTESMRQVCGCEMCIIVERHHGDNGHYIYLRFVQF